MKLHLICSGRRLFLPCFPRFQFYCPADVFKIHWLEKWSFDFVNIAVSKFVLLFLLRPLIIIFAANTYL